MTFSGKKLLVLTGALLLACLSLGAKARPGPAEELVADVKFLKDAGVAADEPGLLEFFKKQTSSAGQRRTIRDLTHEVWVSTGPIGGDRTKGKLVHTFKGQTKNGDALRFDFPKGLNGFDINPDRWYFDSFGYTKYGADPQDLEWLCEWQSPDWPQVTLKGLAPVQADFEWE